LSGLPYEIFPLKSSMYSSWCRHGLPRKIVSHRPLVRTFPCSSVGRETSFFPEFPRLLRIWSLQSVCLYNERQSCCINCVSSVFSYAHDWKAFATLAVLKHPIVFGSAGCSPLLLSGCSFWPHWPRSSAIEISSHLPELLHAVLLWWSSSYLCGACLSYFGYYHL
jgi:hypothetical protein